VSGEARVAEVARMLGGERLATSIAHAQELLGSAAAARGAKKERRTAK
jgi:DNA repair protein RecN (Recombination protein N)